MTTPVFPVESTFDHVVRSVGGKRVTDEVPSPSFENADYVFRSEGVVAELKILELDRSKDEATRNKIQQLYYKWIDNHEPVPIIYGTARLSSNDLSEREAKEMVNVFREPVRQALKKANKQIKQTKDHLGLPAAKGLVLLVNESNVALEPGPMAQMVWQILDAPMFSGIDTLVYLTVNLHASAPWTTAKTRIWAVIERDGRDNVDEDLLNKLREALVKHLIQPGEYTEVYSMGADAIFQMKHDK